MTPRRTLRVPGQLAVVRIQLLVEQQEFRDALLFR